MSESDTVRAARARRLPRRFVMTSGLAAAAVGGVGSVAPAQAAAASTPWKLGGNTAVSTDGTNFLGPVNVAPLIFKTAANNNQPLERMRIQANGRVGINVPAPTAQLDVRGQAVTGRFANTNSAATASAVTATATVGIGVVASSNSGYGVQATTASPDVSAILAQNTATGAFKGAAVQGYAASGTDAFVHPEGVFWDAAGEFSGLNGVIGAAGPEVSDGYGVIGLANNSIGTGVFARGTGGANALIAIGDVDVSGTLTKSGGSFKIDHPLAPAEKYLSHSFVESPDMKNVYDGVVVTDDTGRAAVTLPDWFEALNRDVRYQLTAVGSPAPDLHVAGEVSHGRFTIAGGGPQQKVCWQVTGIRQDAWANAHRIPVAQDKPAADRGRFLNPELFGAAPDARVRSGQGTAR